MRPTIVTALLFASYAFAQGLKLGSITTTGEFEFTQTQKGQQTEDFIAVFNAQNWSLFTRGINVKNGMRRGELAFGIPINVVEKKRLTVAAIPYAGMTTDKAFFGPVFVVFCVFGHCGHYFPDPKAYLTGRGHNHNTLYQEATVSLTKAGGWQARWERLQVIGGFTVSNRFGIERRIWTRNRLSGCKSHFHISPFGDVHTDPSTKRFAITAGFYSGFRWE